MKNILKIIYKKVLIFFILKKLRKNNIDFTLNKKESLITNYSSILKVKYFFYFEIDYKKEIYYKKYFKQDIDEKLVNLLKIETLNDVDNIINFLKSTDENIKDLKKIRNEI